MQKFLDKEGRDFATMLAQNNKDISNESTRHTKNSTTKDNIQQSPTSTESTEYLRGSSDSQRRGASQSEALATLGLRTISLSKQGPSQTANSQGRDGEASRDSEAEQRARRLDYINRELQDRNRAIKSETRQLLQLCNVQTKFTSLEKEEFAQNSQNYAKLQDTQKTLQQKTLKAYKEAGAIIYTPDTKKTKYKK
ncbi:MAG TPA: hypothetical protein IAA33_05845 [Candidatus Helicobacter avicola]|nr:hypothetical protein [Candidatus Helicobacter avicola]